MTEERELQIQRLVDGQLDRSQIRQLLNEAQTSHELSREIAVAYVENQIFCGESRRFANGKSTPAMKRSDCSESPVRPGWLPSLGITRFHLTTAAMLVLAVGMGFMLGQNQTGLGKANTANQGASFDSSNRGLASVPYSLQLLDENGRPIPGQSFPILFEEDAQARGYRSAPVQVPSTLQSQFHKAGWELAPQTQMVEYQLDDGRSVVLPVRNVKLRSYGQ